MQPKAAYTALLKAERNFSELRWKVQHQLANDTVSAALPS